MAARKWLVFDANFLCHRAFYYLIRARGIQNRAIYGFLRDLLLIQELHNTTDVIFCFDKGKSIREQTYPGYKQTRREKGMDKSDFQSLSLEDLKKQITALREDYLFHLGYMNVLSAEGYEADDIIASVCTHTVEPRDEIIIVSADKDLYQLLARGITMWNPATKKSWNADYFTSQYGIPPKKWAEVKALAGCKSDGIRGVEGVGEITAIKYLLGEVDYGSRYQAITSAKGRAIREKNLSYVQLPYEGCPKFTLAKDSVTQQKWKKLCGKLEFRSLTNWSLLAKEIPANE